jgi:RNA polymerase primary sigma factor
MEAIPPACPVEKGLDAPADPTTLYRDSMRFYRYEIGQVHLLSAEEVTTLARRIEQSGGGRKRRDPYCAVEETEESRQAKHLLIESNLRLVVYIANKYKWFGVDLMDLVQEGNLGLMHAVEKFDHTRGYRFSTYAIWWIRHYITRAVAQQAHIIHVPLYKVEEIKRLARVHRRLMDNQEAEPTLEELARHMGISVQQVISLLSTTRETVSLDMPRRGGDDENSLKEQLEDNPTYAPEWEVMSQTLREQIKDLLSRLKPKERAVLVLRYGLDGGKEHSLTETGKLLGISHETARQAERRALGKLNRLCSSKMLQDFLR